MLKRPSQKKVMGVKMNWCLNKKASTLIFILFGCFSTSTYSQCSPQLAPQPLAFTGGVLPSLSNSSVQSSGSGLQILGVGWNAGISSCVLGVDISQYGLNFSGYGVNIGPSVGSGPLSGGFSMVQVGSTTDSFGNVVGNHGSWNGGFVITNEGSYLVKDLVVSGGSFLGTPTTVTYSSIIKFPEIDNTLNINVAVKDISQAISATALNGAHSQPLSRRVEVGKKGFWVSGDLGTDNHGNRSGNAGLADFGFGYNYGPYQLNLSFGETWARQSPAGDSYKSAGNYVLAEAIIPMDGGVWLSLGGYGHKGKFDSVRTYESSLGKSTSYGNTDTKTLGWRVHLDFENAIRLLKIDFSPYVDFSKTISTLDGYSEVGGDYSASFDTRKDRALDFRFGVNGKTLVSENLHFLSVIEGVHRVSETRSHVSGQFTDVGSFDYSSNALKRSWLRFGVGLESKIAEGIGSINFNATTKGEALNAWIAALWVKQF